MERILTVVVHGTPEPGGSKRAFVPTYKKGKRRGQPVRREDGSIVVSVVDDNPKVKAWRQEVARVAQEAIDAAGGIDLGPGVPHDKLALAMRVTFYRARKEGQYGTGRNAHLLKPKSRAFPTVAPDVLKLARAVEDALSGIAYHDDAQTVDLHLYDRYGTPERVELELFVKDEQVAADLPMEERVRRLPADHPAASDPEHHGQVSMLAAA